MLGRSDVERYDRDGFIVVPDVLSADGGGGLCARRPTSWSRRRGRSTITTRSTISSPATAPPSRASAGSRRPDKWDQRYAAIVRHPGSSPACQALWGPNIRFDSAKLNMKAAGFGAPVEWHQDWAFYPHTNDDLAAVGVMIDDMEEENGPLMVIPGSHKGPIHDHHADGRFCGAIDPTRTALDFSAARALPRQGRLDQHPPRAGDPRFGAEYVEPVAALLPAPVPQRRRLAAGPDAAGLGDVASLMVAGEETLEPRLANVPVRLPLPPAANQGSIYENQRDLKNRYFDEPAKKAAAT